MLIMVWVIIHVKSCEGNGRYYHGMLSKEHPVYRVRPFPSKVTQANNRPSATYLLYDRPCATSSLVVPVGLEPTTLRLGCARSSG